jgi:hypothetical protein
VTRWLLAALLLASIPAPGAREHRNHAILRQYRELVPCPSTGLKTGHCPEVIDHWIPICLNPAFDQLIFLHWQDAAEAKAKDKLEWAVCRAAKSRK